MTNFHFSSVLKRGMESRGIREGGWGKGAWTIHDRGRRVPAVWGRRNRDEKEKFAWEKKSQEHPQEGIWGATKKGKKEPGDRRGRTPTDLIKGERIKKTERPGGG